MEYKYYVNAVEFYKDVQKLIPDLNLNRSLMLLDQTFYIKDEYQNTPLINLALGRMNDIIGEEVFSVNTSIVYNDCYTIFYPKGVSVLEGTINAVVEEQFSEEDTELEQQETFEEEEQEIVKEVDWEWVGSLSNVKEDKEKLDNYAEGFGVKLNKVNTLANMIKAFKKAL